MNISVECASYAYNSSCYVGINVFSCVYMRAEYGRVSDGDCWGENSFSKIKLLFICKKKVLCLKVFNFLTRSV